MNLIDNRTAYNREQYQGYHNTHEYISIHYLGVDGENPDLYGNGYGGHYTIMWNGDIYWSADHYAVLWQVGTAGVYTKKYPNGWDVTNYNSIGIEMCCHYTDGHWWFTEETQEACVELVKYLLGLLKLDADHVLRHYDIVNKECLPVDSTEVLSREGWKSLDELSVGDEIIQYDTEADSLTFGMVQDIVEPYKAEVLKCHSFEATANHRMWAKPNCKNSKRFKEITWGEMLQGHKFQIVKNASFYKGEGLPLTDEELRLLVWTQGDGHYMKKKDGTIYGLEFHLKKPRKIERVHQLLDDLGIPYADSYKRDGSVAIRRYDTDIVEWCEGWLDHKQFTYKLLEMTDEQFKTFWDELMMVDGCLKTNLYASTQQQNIDVVQALCAMHGVRTNNCTLGKKTKDALVTSRTNYSIGGEWKKIEKRKTLVSCVTVPTGFVLVRQNGKTFITGNCPMPYVRNDKYKSSWTWDEFKAKIKGGAMATDYKQYDFDITYSDGPFSQQGCGPTSCADLLNISPVITAQWLTNHGYAEPGHGTRWEGIAPCLTAFGGGGKQLNSNSLLTWRTSPVFDAWQKHIQSGYMGILLMGAGKSTYWTSSGHFIAIVEYRDGMYLVYDPASVNRTGWHPWTDFAGDIKVCYTSTIRWGNPQDEEDIVVSEIFKNARIDKEFDRPVMRYVGIDKLEVKEAPGKDAPRHSYWPWLSKNNGVKVFYGFDTGYVQVSMSNGKGTGTSGFVEAKYLSKKKV